jgi:hypothetical protein
MSGTKPMMGTQNRLSDSMMSEDFDANNRTLDASSKNTTLRQFANQVPSNPRTDYDKPWYREPKKDYLKDTKEITISFDEKEEEEQELPSQV